MKHLLTIAIIFYTHRPIATCLLRLESQGIAPDIAAKQCYTNTKPIKRMTKL